MQNQHLIPLGERENQLKITQPINQQIEVASEENPSLLGQQKEVNIKDFEEKDNFK